MEVPPRGAVPASMTLMMTGLPNDHGFVAVRTLSAVCAITVHLSARTVALLMAPVTLLMASLDHDGLRVGDRWRGDNYKRCDH